MKEKSRVDVRLNLLDLFYAKTFSKKTKYRRALKGGVEMNLTHLCRPVRSTFAVRETASLGIMGEPRVSPLHPSESIVL